VKASNLMPNDCFAARDLLVRGSMLVGSVE
jgi:hypothetical protein